MTSASTGNRNLGFAPEHDQPVRYMQRTREWYLALGYDNPYVWAHYIDVPFQPLRKPLSECCITVVTTAAPYQPDKGPQGPGAPYNSAAKFYQVYSGATAEEHDLRISHVGIDRKHTSMEDSRTWFPLQAMRDAVSAGRIGRLAARFHGAPTNRSQQHTIDVDCPEILARCRDDGVDAMLLLPNCPICHQTLSLVARHLEANGISTVIMGCAKDIVEYCGVPRFLFSDFPLGNAAGRPHDPVSQMQTLELGLRLLESAPGPRTTLQSPLRWAEDADWKLDYCHIARKPPEEIAALRAEPDHGKAIAKQIREATLVAVAQGAR
jgi:hypothetical protein